MKKIISVCLAVALAASMLCMNIFAAGTPVVGHYGETGKVADGITASEFGDTNSSSDIKLSLITTSESRYAVDIEFKDTAKSFSANFVWNVNTHEYQVKEGTSNSDPLTINPNLTITNHSDKPVYYKATIAAETVTDLTITASITGTEKSNVPAVVVGGNATTADVAAEVTVKSNIGTGTWAEYINAGKGNITDVKVATYTVTISKDTIA